MWRSHTNKQHYRFFILTCTLVLSFLGFCLVAEAEEQIAIQQTNGQRSAIGNTQLTFVTDDNDNGDGIGDGALYVNGLTAEAGQGVEFILRNTMMGNESIDVSTYTYNPKVSYVRYDIQLINSTDNAVRSTERVQIPGNTSQAVNTQLSYVTGSQDVGDELVLRYVRVDGGETYRDFAIDSIVVNGRTVPMYTPCYGLVTPDLPLPTSTPAIDAEIDLIVSRFSDDYLGTTPPTTTELSDAIAEYHALSIAESGDVIVSNPISNLEELGFLRTFATHLKFNPTDSDIIEKANHVVRLGGQLVCDGEVKRPYGSGGYRYRAYARPTSLLHEHLTPQARELFEYTLFEAMDSYVHFWEPTYDEAHQIQNDAINTDTIHTVNRILLAMAMWQETPEERLQFMNGFKRYMDRFASYSVGTTNGIKPDGSGFHHWNAYNGYMRAYKVYADTLWYLRGTAFQIDQDSYLVYRDAKYTQFMQANDSGAQALSTAGRGPNSPTMEQNAGSLKRTALVGGDILGTGASDPVMAQLYNRIYGVDPDFDDSTVADFEEGFFQFNYASAGAYRKDNWLAFNKGFTSGTWGAEIYGTSNRWGRYQSYGALEILYPGDKLANGYDPLTWDWNFNPGATTIQLPWSMLHTERERVDELQEYGFVGSLAFDRASFTNRPLSHVTGASGMFAMDFEELPQPNGWGDTYSSSNHNGTFKFRKSSFYFDDMIVNLATGISNNDNSNQTVTTLYQRLDNTGDGIIANGQSITGNANQLAGAADNWILNNFGTGFYIFDGNHTINLTYAPQQTPNQNQLITDDFSSNPTGTYYIGYLNHGTSPNNQSYEYIIKLAADNAEMTTLANEIQNGAKPYIVQQQSDNAHIISYDDDNSWAYAFFEPASGMTGPIVQAINEPALLMHRFDPNTGGLLLAIAQPDLDLQDRDYTPAIDWMIDVTLNGEWTLTQPHPDVSLISSTTTDTTFQFQLGDGLPVEVELFTFVPTNVTLTTNETQDSQSGILTSIILLLMIGTFFLLRKRSGLL